MNEEDLKHRLKKVELTLSSSELPDRDKQHVSETLELLVERAVEIRREGGIDLPEGFRKLTIWLATARGQWRAANNIHRAFIDFLISNPQKEQEVEGK